jgi:protein SCO1/2
VKPAIVFAFLLLGACSRPQPLEVLGAIPAFELSSHNGGTFVSSKELAGRIWAANFIFTNCQGPCPRMSSQMRQVQSGTSNLPDVRMVSFTVDPARDTPAVLAEYAKRQHAESRWVFLTGPQETLHHLKRQAFLLGNVDGELNHSTRFVLVDKQQQIRAYYDSSEPDSIKRLIADIRRLSKES